MMQPISAEEIKTAMETAVPECRVEVILNGSPSAQHSLLIDKEQAV
jgi:NADH-quinone oxidoreductase subunit C